MDTGSTGTRRISRLGTTPPVGRIAGGKTTEIAPTEAVSATGSATQSDARGSQQEADNERSPEERFALASETQQVLLAAADEDGTDASWRMPGGMLAQRYGEFQPGPAESEPPSEKRPPGPRPLRRTV